MISPFSYYSILFGHDSQGNSHHFINKLYSNLTFGVHIFGNDSKGIQKINEMILTEFAIEGGHFHDIVIKKLDKIQGIMRLRDDFLLDFI